MENPLLLRIAANASCKQQVTLSPAFGVPTGSNAVQAKRAAIIPDRIAFIPAHTLAGLVHSLGFAPVFHWVVRNVEGAVGFSSSLSQRNDASQPERGIAVVRDLAGPAGLSEFLV